MNTGARLRERREERIAAGRAADERIRDGEHFNDWVAVADALTAIKEEAMEAANAPNNPKHPRYRAEFKRIIETRETWAARYGDAERAHCYWLIDHLPAVMAWRDTLGKRRDEWNHPSTVKRNFELMTAVKPPKAEVVEALKPPARQDDPLDIVRMLRAGVFPPGTSMSEVADALEAGLNFNTLKRLHTEIGKRIERSERQGRGRCAAQAREQGARSQGWRPGRCMT
jgi:hypothetical protein